MEHQTYCRKEKEIGVIQAKVERIEKEVMGNNGAGLSKTVPLLAQKLDQLDQNLQTNNTLTSGVLRFKDELEGRAKGKESLRKRNQWIVGTIIAIASLVLAVLIPLLIKVFKVITEFQTNVQ